MTIVAERPSVSPRPQRIIGFITASSIVIANIIGTGIFTSLGFQVADIQSGFPLLMLLGEAGVLALEAEVLMIETANQPGVLATIAERLADAEVNIEYVYLAGGRGTEKGLIVLRPSDIDKAQRALQDL